MCWDTVNLDDLLVDFRLIGDGIDGLLLRLLQALERPKFSETSHGLECEHPPEAGYRL
jgi:hypothetical protein